MSPVADDALTGFDRLCGVELVEVSPELVRGRLQVRDHHKQPAGLVHGGVYATIAESMAVAGTTQAVAADGRGATGLSTQTSFMRPVTGGHIDATARPRHRGRSTWVWEVEIADGEGRLCVLCRVTISAAPRR
jgi:1,4-dihydroxy-2-naphthoyl-CoA hydrolase